MYYYTFSLTQSNHKQTLPSMATCTSPLPDTNTNTNTNTNGDGDGDGDGYEMISVLNSGEIKELEELETKMGTQQKPQIITTNVPLYDMDKISWRIECTRYGTFLKISIVSCEKLNKFIELIKLFQELTFFGTPKISLSPRNALKFRIPINNRYINIQTKERYLETPTILFNGKYQIYKFIVKNDNYEHDKYVLNHLLNKHYEHKFGTRDELGILDANFLTQITINKLRIEYKHNDNFCKVF